MKNRKFKGTDIKVLCHKHIWVANSWHKMALSKINFTDYKRKKFNRYIGSYHKCSKSRRFCDISFVFLNENPFENCF